MWQRGRPRFTYSYAPQVSIMIAGVNEDLKTMTMEQDFAGAFSRINQFFGSVNDLGQRTPDMWNSLVEGVTYWVSSARGMLSTIARSFGASSFSVSVSATGVSFSLSFDI